jgi:hypothetical protein
MANDKNTRIISISIRGASKSREEVIVFVEIDHQQGKQTVNNINNIGLMVRWLVGWLVGVVGKVLLIHSRSRTNLAE